VFTDTRAVNIHPPRTIPAARDRRPAAANAAEAFLDFDPVFPGWPPETERPTRTHRVAEADRIALTDDDVRRSTPPTTKGRSS
jgi:hypothetical protein